MICDNYNPWNWTLNIDYILSQDTMSDNVYNVTPALKWSYVLGTSTYEVMCLLGTSTYEVCLLQNNLPPLWTVEFYVYFVVITTLEIEL
jgi:hypothetical protein